ncbi:hypothetical protein [Neomegalonema sp.]|uniref:hypothetical protein n=1 Tax=Neomegalonema sp. TaxID=2039713 RepID=UPI0026231C1C|nr:hypothetical protein [Neomegalonema sp.]MDD2867259.1 hypothetical protein [Neomegalonema sp.]
MADLTSSIAYKAMSGRPNVDALAACWLQDQSIAFAATLLGKIDAIFEPRPFACASLIAESIDAIHAGLLSDSTLALVSTIDRNYYDKDRLANWDLLQLLSVADPLELAVTAAQAELAKRDGIGANGLNRVLISHAVYLLRRPHLSCLKFLKWLNRAAPHAAPGVKRVLAGLLQTNSTMGAQVEEALAKSRDAFMQTRDRLDGIDAFHGLVLEAAGEQRDQVSIWWARICMAYRSSLFCWPLLTERSSSKEDGGARGLSLPISLFMIEDGKSRWRPEPNPRGQRIWFKYKLSRSEERVRAEPRFREARDGLPSHIDGFRFGLTQEWWRAFAIGMDVAKKLWASQNGRFRFTASEAADRKLQASLNVDLRAACDIVESVFSSVPEDDWSKLGQEKHFFIVADRSAEAYWVQCVLALLLPSGDLPMGLCTGTIDYHDGEFEVGNVKGVVEKLEYANRAGFPRVVVPGDGRDFHGENPLEADELDVGEGVSGDPPSSEVDAGRESADDATEADRVKAELKAFLDRLEAREIHPELKGLQDRLEAHQARKTLEVNFARTARAAADAMQPSGWRRTDFLRTPEFKRTFGRTQKRLFIRDALGRRLLARRLKREEIADYRRNSWRDDETQEMEMLDRLLLSRTGRMVKHVEPSAVRRIAPSLSVEKALGKWAAWKDNQVRAGESGGKGPGLGVVTLRTAEGDTETRLWAALAEMLDADDGWWEKFQWADLPEAADLLAQLLCNHHADPRISPGSAPDLLIVFDDASLATRRTNSIFPEDFHHQFIDLLNPRHQTNHKFDHLDKALKQHDRGIRDLKTRILVVLKEEMTAASAPRADVAEAELPSQERALLEQLGIFRFGCSRHAGYAMANFQIEGSARLTWKGFTQITDVLIARRLLSVSGNVLTITPKGRRALADMDLSRDPWRCGLAHRHAALALCPILHPQGARISTNRDRQLEPESVLEATWHLKQAFDLVPWRFRSRWRTVDGLPPVPDSQALLTFVRTSPDWDTVLRLRVNSVTRQESVDLCRELLSAQREARGREPPSSVVGLAIETMGRVFKNENQSKDSIEPQALEIIEMVDRAMDGLKNEGLTKSARQRRLRHLLSRQIFALRMLGLPLTDPRMADARSYIDTAVSAILKSDFLQQIGDGREGLDDFPISLDCWRTLWADGNRTATPNKTLSVAERSRYAYAAVRANLARSKADHPPSEPWDEAWIAYFILTRPEVIGPRQIVAPLNTWWDVYGKNKGDAKAFGRRVLDLQPHAQRSGRGKGPWQERWLADLGEGCSNLWRFVTNPEPELRLVGPPVAPALRLIAVLAMEETLPAWRFMQESGPEWHDRWPEFALKQHRLSRSGSAAEATEFVADEWSALGRAVVSHRAGWVAMLAHLAACNEEIQLLRVKNWLRSLEGIGVDQLQDSDPENLQKALSMPLVGGFSKAQQDARMNARFLLGLQKNRRFSLYGHYRKLFQHLLHKSSF